MFLSFIFDSNLNDAASIGIIGGSDGPTSIYVGNPQSSYLITVIFTLLSIIGIVFLIITKKKKDN
jgi:Na+-transporting methylmalonyl-CoA/oxaloacetate decarboxylase beta subunit